MLPKEFDFLDEISALAFTKTFDIKVSDKLTVTCRILTSDDRAFIFSELIKEGFDLKSDASQYPILLSFLAFSAVNINGKDLPKPHTVIYTEDPKLEKQRVLGMSYVLIRERLGKLSTTLVDFLCSMYEKNMSDLGAEELITIHNVLGKDNSYNLEEEHKNVLESDKVKAGIVGSESRQLVNENQTAFNNDAALQQRHEEEDTKRLKKPDHKNKSFATDMVSAKKPSEIGSNDMKEYQSASTLTTSYPKV